MSLRTTVSWAQHLKGRAYIPLAALSFPASKQVPFTTGFTERVFQLSDGQSPIRGEWLYHN